MNSVREEQNSGKREGSGEIAEIESGVEVRETKPVKSLGYLFFFFIP